MHLPRMTTRGLMVFVILVGLALHFAMSARRVYATKEYHFHTWVFLSGNKPFATISSANQPPFWPRYWRCILGLPWRGRALCQPVDGHFLEMCEFAHPEIRKPLGGGRSTVVLTQGQNDLQKRLKERPR